MTRMPNFEAEAIQDFNKCIAERRVKAETRSDFIAGHVELSKQLWQRQQRYAFERANNGWENRGRA